MLKEKERIFEQTNSILYSQKFQVIHLIVILFQTITTFVFLCCGPMALTMNYSLKGTGKWNTFETFWDLKLVPVIHLNKLVMDCWGYSLA